MEARSRRAKEVWYFTQTDLAAARIGDYKIRPARAAGRLVRPHREGEYAEGLQLAARSIRAHGVSTGSVEGQFPTMRAENLWRAVYLQQHVAVLAKSAIEYPPLQQSASFNLDAVHEEDQVRTARPRTLSRCHREVESLTGVGGRVPARPPHLPLPVSAGNQ